MARTTGDPTKPEDIRAAILSVIEATPAKFIAEAIDSFPARLRARAAQNGGIFEHTLPAYKKKAWAKLGREKKME